MSEPQASTVVGIVTGTAATTFPIWADLVALFTGVNQLLVAGLGILVLMLTALKLWTELRLARRRLRDAENGDGK